MRVQPKGLLARILFSKPGKIFLLLVILLNVAALTAFTYYYARYAKLVDQKLAEGPFQNTSLLYSAPDEVAVGDAATPDEIAVQLRRAGYSENRTNKMGWYHLRPDAVEIFPGAESYYRQEPGVVKFAAGKVIQIISLRDNTSRNQYMLEPELITNLFDKNRQKRRLVSFNEIPKLVVNAVTAAEDKRFFDHAGFDPIRLTKAAYRDLREGRKAEGASTITQQVARMFWLSTEKTMQRKAAELLITLHLEAKLSKEQIFEFYVNQVPLGANGSFQVNGIAQGAQVFFNKDLSQLKLEEAALLAGMIQRPSAFNPYRAPERARKRRNIVLWMMRENELITDRQYKEASELPLSLAPRDMDSSEAPYFVDLVNESLQTQFSNMDFMENGYRVYTTLDMNLQRAAAEALREGMAEVDEQIKRRFKGEVPRVQAALVALDANTGEVKALIGGRDYGQSQLNRALAKRQPGSVFKPFVYAAALNTGLTEGSTSAITPATLIVDEPTTFYYDGKPYEPGNFKGEYHGTVTVRDALKKSMNIPTVKLAEQVGYSEVVGLARKAGMNMDIRATPAVALGAYEVTPLEVAGSYTTFTNAGVAARPTWIRNIRDSGGRSVWEGRVDRQQVLDPRVNYLMVSLMESVINNGTAAGARSRGFTLPAAGKTGTSHDGWFAGFTSKLICAVWVGFDDNRELKLEGSKSALPIWTAFMKRAHSYRAYRNVHGWEAPEGIVAAAIDPATGELAGPATPNPRTEYFLAGTQPVTVSRLQDGGVGTQVSGWDEPGRRDVKRIEIPVSDARPAAPAATPVAPAAATRSTPVVPPPPVAGDVVRPEDPVPQRKRGLFGKLKDIFKN